MPPLLAIFNSCRDILMLGYVRLEREVRSVLSLSRTSDAVMSAMYGAATNSCNIADHWDAGGRTNLAVQQPANMSN